MSNIDKQALREEFQFMQDHYSDPADRENQVIYIAAEALLDENLQLQRDKDSLEAAALAVRDDMREAREKLESAEKRITDQHGIILSARNFISEYAQNGDVGATEFVKILDHAAGIGVKGE
ncbi:TPA: ead/Ea22-like family protein [Citrobacter freundii]